MKIIETFGFWLTIVSLGICFHNWLGYDDKNMLLYLLGLPNLLLHILEPLFPALRAFAENELYFTIYIINVVYYLLIGMFIDFVVKKLRNN